MQRGRDCRRPDPLVGRRDPAERTQETVVKQLAELVNWIERLDGVWLFLLILVFVVGVVMLWSRGLKGNETGERVRDD